MCKMHSSETDHIIYVHHAWGESHHSVRTNSLSHHSPYTHPCYSNLHFGELCDTL